MLKNIEERIENLRKEKERLKGLIEKYKDSEEWQYLSFACEGRVISMNEEINYLKKLVKMIKGE